MAHIAHDINAKQRTKDIKLQSDITFNMMLFPETLLSGLKICGFEKPSPIQLKTIPLARCGFDLIVEAKAGMGKTLIFALTALETVNSSLKNVQVVIITPTREIALQIQEVVNNIACKIPDVKVNTFIGGLKMGNDVKFVKHCHIAIGTPGRIRQLIELKHLVLDKVKLFVLDEADQLTSKSLHPDINFIHQNLPSNKQTLALSATFSKDLLALLGNYMKDARHITPDSLTTVDNEKSYKPDTLLLGITQYVIPIKCNDSNSTSSLVAKEKMLLKLLATVNFNQAIIFSNYHTRAESLCKRLVKENWPAVWIAGSMDQPERIEAMKNLKEQRSRVLVTTDLTARGIDVDCVNLVVNMDIPNDHRIYLHRMGRAGRYGSYGIVVTIITTNEINPFRKMLGKVGGNNLSVNVVDEHNIINLWESNNKFDQITGIEIKEPSTENVTGVESCSDEIYGVIDSLKPNEENKSPISFDSLNTSLINYDQNKSKSVELLNGGTDELTDDMIMNVINRTSVHGKRKESEHCQYKDDDIFEINLRDLKKNDSNFEFNRYIEDDQVIKMQVLEKSPKKKKSKNIIESKKHSGNKESNFQISIKADKKSYSKALLEGRCKMALSNQQVSGDKYAKRIKPTTFNGHNISDITNKLEEKSCSNETAAVLEERCCQLSSGKSNSDTKDKENRRRIKPTGMKTSLITIPETNEDKIKFEEKVKYQLGSPKHQFNFRYNSTESKNPLSFSELSQALEKFSNEIEEDKLSSNIENNGIIDDKQAEKESVINKNSTILEREVDSETGKVFDLTSQKSNAVLNISFKHFPEIISEFKIGDILKDMSVKINVPQVIKHIRFDWCKDQKDWKQLSNDELHVINKLGKKKSEELAFNVNLTLNLKMMKVIDESNDDTLLNEHNTNLNEYLGLMKVHVDINKISQSSERLTSDNNDKGSIDEQLKAKKGCLLKKVEELNQKIANISFTNKSHSIIDDSINICGTDLSIDNSPSVKKNCRSFNSERQSTSACPQKLPSRRRFQFKNAELSSFSSSDDTSSDASYSGAEYVINRVDNNDNRVNSYGDWSTMWNRQLNVIKDYVSLYRNINGYHY